MILFCFVAFLPLSPLCSLRLLCRLQQCVVREYQVLQHYLLPSLVEGQGEGLLLQRYNSVPWDVKRGGRFGGDLTLSHGGYWQWLQLYNQRYKKPSAIAIRHSQKMHINTCKIGVCKDNSRNARKVVSNSIQLQMAIDNQTNRQLILYVYLFLLRHLKIELLYYI